jgi:nicotinamidase-related amidase
MNFVTKTITLGMNIFLQKINVLRMVNQKLGESLMDEKNKALIIIDVQKAFNDKKWGERNNLNAEENISKILKLWRGKGWPVIYIQHMSDNPSSVFHPKNDGFAIKELVAPMDEEVVITKKVNSSFIGTNLEKFLKLNDITTVVITGLTTPHCVSTTTRMSGNLGFNTYLISDATAAFGITDQDDTYYCAETIHNISLATLHDEFATILTTEQLINKNL